ncbi:hypothetical protein CDD82_4090 [Ophiocordyceps australis]|uniref:F-box domain-containing protein n=1 Tax=Ophiocordyceps australis TaxID=1399860 RepID=A0A2C5ZSK9_9HYPO|nr:hypothetical protein CDD82_4090 [Ophiocordyceps australis]
MEACILKGKKTLNQAGTRGLRKSRNLFTSAIKLCTCSHTSSCWIDFKTIVANSKDGQPCLFPCACVDEVPCSKLGTHLLALRHRSICHSLLNNCRGARRDAETMIAMAPEDPQGYIRLGEVLRFQDMPEVALEIFRAGIRACHHVGGERAQSHVDRLRALCGDPRVIPGRCDPIQMPVDVIFIIFTSMEVQDLMTCLRVSKGWKGALESTPCKHLFKILTLTRPIRTIPVKNSMVTFAQRFGSYLHTIKLAPTVCGQITPANLDRLLRACPNLVQLRVPLSCFPGITLPQNAPVIKFQKLRNLTVFGAGNQTVPDDHNFPVSIHQEVLLQEFIALAADTLEYLDIPLLPRTWSPLQQPQAVPLFTQLRYLRINPTVHTSTPLLVLATNTPLLQELTINNIHIGLGNLRAWTQTAHQLWNHLEALNIDFDERFAFQAQRELVHTVLTIATRTCRESLRHLSLSTKHYPDILDNVADCHFGKIETLRFTGPVFSPVDTHSFLRQALHDGTLKTIEITFPLDDYNNRSGQIGREFFGLYDWLKGCKTLRCLSLLKINLDLSHYEQSECPLTQFICSFRNLDTLSLQGPIHASRFVHILTQVFKKTRLRRIYTDSFTGRARRHVESQAELLGLEFKAATLPRPRGA